MSSKEFLKAMKWIWIVAFICFAAIIGFWLQLYPLARLQKNQKLLEDKVYALTLENLEQFEQIEQLRREVRQDIYLNGKWE